MADYQPAQLEHLRKPALQSEPRLPAAVSAPEHPLVALNARAGNQAVARLVQRAAEDEEVQASHDSSLQREEQEEDVQMRHEPALQREEQEEDVQMRHDPALQREEQEEDVQMRHDPALQRAENDEELQMRHESTPRVGLEGGPVGADIEGRVNAMRGSGSTAPEGVRNQMEAATGVDLSSVRVHEGKEADSLNRELTAKAFTTGSDIYLRSDSSSSDSELMAHELAHVVQQSSGRTGAGGNGMTAGAADHPLEAEADALAHDVLSGTAQRDVEEATA